MKRMSFSVPRPCGTLRTFSMTHLNTAADVGENMYSSISAPSIIKRSKDAWPIQFSTCWYVAMNARFHSSRHKSCSAQRCLRRLVELAQLVEPAWPIGVDCQLFTSSDGADLDEC